MVSLESIRRYGGPSLDRGETYLYISPHPLLSPYIANYTVTCPSHGAMTDTYTILPTASATLSYSIDSRGITGGLRGVNTRAAVVGAHANRYDTLLLIEFHPGGLYPLLRIPQSELLDDSFPFAQLNAQLDQEIITAVMSTDTIHALKDRLDLIFLSRLADMAIHPGLAHAMRIILRTHGAANLHTLASGVFLGERQLERIFAQNLGTSVKKFSRIVRLNHTLRLLHAPNNGMATLAAEAGYHDQSHFIKDFQAFCRATPKEYISRMSDFYNDTTKL